MIISASRRTDIPAFFGEWFANRVRSGYAAVRNPFDAKQVRAVSLLPEDVDGYVFWTKNPSPFLPFLRTVEDVPAYFHITVTGAPRQLEPHVPDAEEVVLPAARRIVERLGAQSVVWRFDPVTGLAGVPEIISRFQRLAACMESVTDECVVSFLQQYRSSGVRLRGMPVAPEPEQYVETACALSEIGRRHGITVRACCLPDSRLLPAAVCVDTCRLSRIAGHRIAATKDRGQRPRCRCAKSVDIGAYGTCTHGCLYCYAVRGSFARAEERMLRHDPQDPMLISDRGPTPADASGPRLE